LEIRTEVEVRRPPEAVYDFLIDTASFPLVDRALRAWTPDGVMREGLQGTFVHRRGLATARSTWSVEELARPTRIRVTIRGMGYEMVETATLLASGEGTLATFTDTVRPTSLLGRPLVALSGRIMRRDLSARAALLKAALEA
jgi:hypothetical protein